MGLKITLNKEGIQPVPDKVDTLFIGWSNWKNQVGATINDQTEKIRVKWIYGTTYGEKYTEEHSVEYTSTTTSDELTIDLKYTKWVNVEVTPIAYDIPDSNPTTKYWSAEVATPKSSYDVKLQTPPKTITEAPSFVYDPQTGQARLTAYVDRKEDDYIVFQVLYVDDYGTTIPYKVYEVNTDPVTLMGSISITLPTAKNPKTTVKTDSTNVTVSTEIPFLKFIARCYARRGPKEDKNWSWDWSPLSETVMIRLPKPSKFTSYYKLTTINVFELYWDVPKTLHTYISKYVIEYTQSITILNDGTVVFNNPSTYEVNDPEIQYASIPVDNMERAWYFRYATVSNGDNEVQSPWSDHVVIPVGSTPAVPTVWSNVVTAKTSDQIILNWTHNPTDNSPLKESRLWWTTGDYNDESKWHYEDIFNPDPVMNPNRGSYTLPKSVYENGARPLYWQVRTKGYSDIYSPWSMTQEINIYKEPDIRVGSGPSETTTWTKYPVVISMTGTADLQSPVTATIVITANNSYRTTDSMGNIIEVPKGAIVYSNTIQSFSGTTSGYTNSFSHTWSLSAVDLSVPNGEEHTVKVIVGFDSGLTAEGTTGIIINHTRIRASTYVTTSYVSDTKRLWIKPCISYLNGSTEDDFLCQVYRANVNGSYDYVGSVDAWYHLSDPYPTFGRCRYRVIYIGRKTGEYLYYDTPYIDIKETSIVIQWDEHSTNYDRRNDVGYESSPMMLDLPYNIKTNDDTKVEVELVKYSGRENPVSYYGTSKTTTVSWSSDIPKKDIERIDKLRHLMNWAGDVYVREPSGNGYWATVNVSFSQSYDDVIIPVTIQVTKVEGGA